MSIFKRLFARKMEELNDQLDQSVKTIEEVEKKLAEIKEGSKVSILKSEIKSLIDKIVNETRGQTVLMRHGLSDHDQLNQYITDVCAMLDELCEEVKK